MVYHAPCTQRGPGRRKTGRGEGTGGSEERLTLADLVEFLKGPTLLDIFMGSNTSMERWYVVHTKPWKEIFLSTQFQLRNVETFCPVIHVHPVNPRSRKIKPYFPGYLFIHVDLERVHFSQLNWIPGATGLVYLGGEPAFVPDHLIQALRARLDHLNSIHADPLAGLQPGDLIEIQSGPFAGYQAIFDHRISGSERVRVLLKFLANREIWLELPAQYVHPPH